MKRESCRGKNIFKVALWGISLCDFVAEDDIKKISYLQEFLNLVTQFFSLFQSLPKEELKKKLSLLLKKKKEYATT